MNFRACIFVLVLMAAFTVAVPAAHAQKIQELFDKAMPDFPAIPEEKLINNTALHEQMPGGDQSMAYEIRLPKDWSQDEEAILSNYTLSEKLLGDIAVYYGPPRVDALRSYFKIQALQMKYEITADQWFLEYALSNGYTLEGLDAADNRKVSAIHVLIDKNDTYYVYSIAQINGKRMILAQFFIPSEYWFEEGALVHECAKSMKLLNPEVSLIENMIEYPFVDLVSLDYPESWKLRSFPVRTVDRMNVSFSNIRPGESKVLDGLIEVEMISSFTISSLEEEIDEIKSKARKKGLIMGSVIESIEGFEFNDNVEYGFIDVYDTSDTQNESLRYEIWIATITLGDYYGFATLTTPNRDDEFFTWSRNVGAFKSILKTIRLQKSLAAD